MQTLMRKSVCALLSLLLLLSVVLPVKAAAETAPVKVVRVGSFEDTFNYVNEKGARKGYGYELLQTLSGYTGWQFEYVTCDWSNCFEKLKNGEIDIMGGISYTEDRTEEMLFSDEPMGVEKYYLYADLSRADISASDFKTLNGKKIGVLMGTEPEVMLAEWEEKYGLKTEHVNISNNEDVKQKLANHEIDCFVSLEESFWAVTRRADAQDHRRAHLRTRHLPLPHAQEPRSRKRLHQHRRSRPHASGRSFRLGARHGLHAPRLRKRPALARKARAHLQTLRRISRPEGRHRP